MGGTRRKSGFGSVQAVCVGRRSVTAAADCDTGRSHTDGKCVNFGRDGGFEQKGTLSMFAIRG